MAEKVFISVGMRGRDDEAIQADIDTARKDILALMPDAEIVDNFVEAPKDNTNRLYCLGEAIKKIGECDIVYFCPGTFNFSGCIIERMVCDKYKIPTIDSTWSDGVYIRNFHEVVEE